MDAKNGLMPTKELFIDILTAAGCNKISDKLVKIYQSARKEQVGEHAKLALVFAQLFNLLICAPQPVYFRFYLNSFTFLVNLLESGCANKIESNFLKVLIQFLDSEN